MRRIEKISTSLLTAAAIVGILGWTSLSGRVMAAPASYSASLFAPNPTGTSGPDSIVVSGNSVFVGYGNGTASDGTDPRPNTIAQFTTGGQLVKTFSVPGHNDGLRVNPANGRVYALLNQDGNPMLTIIDPSTSAQTTYTLPAESGRGYDDLQFLNGQIFASVSNPIDDTSTILAQLTFDSVANKFNSISVLLDTFTGVDPSGNPVNFTAQDPDSLALSPNGSLLLDDQSGGALISIANPGTPQQKATVISHSAAVVDDTVIATPGVTSLLVASTSGSTTGVYQITGPFTLGTAYTSVTGSNFVGSLDLSSGVVTSVVGGLSSPHGLAFTSVPEPSQAL